MYIVDTNVVSELRKGTRADRNVHLWDQSVPAEDLYLSAISILEIEVGILLVQRRDREQGAVLRNWMTNQVLPAFVGRILAIDGEVAQRCAALHVPDAKPERDALIAATALVHGMTVVTRNVNDFRSMGVSVIDPWQ